MFIISQSLKTRKSELRVSHEVVIRMWWGLQSSEGWTEVGRSFSKMAHPHGCWQEAWVPHHVGVSKGLLERLHNTVIGFPQSE